MYFLVSGAHGFIGSHLVENLLHHDHTVRALVSPWGKTDNLAGVLDHPRLELCRADITESNSLTGTCDGIEVIVHGAARVADWGRWQEFYRSNVGGTENLITEAIRQSVKRFVLVSSVAVHRFTGFSNANPRSLPRDNTKNPYARSKILAEDLLMASSIEWTIVRPGLWPFGPRDPNFIRVAAALKGGRLPYVGKGHHLINTAFILNLVEGLRLAAIRPEAARKVYVIADEGAPSWSQLFTALAELLGVPPPHLKLSPTLVNLAAALAESLWALTAPGVEPPLTRYRALLMQSDIHFSLEDAKLELGYQPTSSWRQGLEFTVNTL